MNTLVKPTESNTTQSEAKHFYMVPPTYFEIEYKINDWMDLNDKVDKEKAQAQWQSLYDTYIELGAKVDLIDAMEGLPDQVFPGDSIMLYGDTAISGNFRFKERQPEEEPMAEWFADLGYAIHRIPDGIKFEGNAEAMLWNGRILAGYGLRTDFESHAIINDILGLEVESFKLNAPFFHLDTALCPIDAETIAYAPNAFDAADRERVEALAPNMVAVSPEEANYMACNSKVIGNTVIISNQRTPNFAAALNLLGFETIVLDMSEFRKSGAGAKCLTLEAYSN